MPVRAKGGMSRFECEMLHINSFVWTLSPDGGMIFDRL